MTPLSFHQNLGQLPSYDEIPVQEGVPQGATWGLWDKDGQKDELGTLNLLTPQVIKEAAEEVREGISVSLDLPLDQPSVSVFQRQRLCHIIRDNSNFSSSQSFDDTISFNTSASSQWDGLRHVIHEGAGLLYNGIPTSEITGPEATTRLGIQKWHEKGRLVGRGVLIDFVRYAQRHGIHYCATKFFGIGCRYLELAAREQNVDFKQGDVLLVRTGFMKWYKECKDISERDEWFRAGGKESIGIAPDQETVGWVWNHHFSAVAGDNLGWEAIPFPNDTPSFHQYLLASWGTPIGELWDLEELARQCQDLNRYTFMLVSVPLKVPGGVASPPNAVAIF